MSETSSQSEIERVLRDFILQTFLPGDDADKLTGDYPLVSTGIVDSAGLVVLLTHLEDRYSVTFTVEEIASEEVETIETIARAVHRKVRKR